MNLILRYLNKLFFCKTSFKPNTKSFKLQNYLYSKLQKCPHCKIIFWQENKKKERYKVLKVLILLIF